MIAVNPTVMLIIFAESIILSFNNLKLIKGDDAFFSMTTNANTEVIDVIEKMIICIKSFPPVFSKS